ncbi:MAG: helix-turn-helix domain-containing protein [Thermogemmatispora sp.]|uniref:helix-turn-helix domain-containing protein n=1 Tax=Thermogemmatispora sp. TaxID=1968838 RepID=UPI0019E851EA|nr:helix-turn-helix domain-containing protein [Thermogemmatispora sp.]MBE3565842.1 helix-turn-helix domain-containing protein [Thermogemmatispora sp.]
MLPKNTFGHLIRTYRRLRGWSQADLAQRWGYSREYVSQIERGKRKLDSLQQVLRLADLLDIPQDQLDAIGRGIPRRSIQIQRPEQADSAILQMLLAPSRDMVQLSYLLWIADQAPSLQDKLHDLVSQLDQALISYHGDLLKPAQQLLAYAHQMLGRMAVDRLDLAAAAGHFSEAIALGEELRDPDLLTIGMVYQGSLLRKRGRFETAIRCFEAARQHLGSTSPATQGMYYVHLSTVYADSGQETPFLRCIEQALDLASSQQDSLAGLVNDFSLDDVLWAKAGGFSELWKPAEALKVYEQTDKLRPFRPLREQGAYLIDKGEAYLRLGELDEGISLSLKGIELATSYQSRRQLGWVEKTYQRLRVLPIGKDKRLDTLKDALSEARRKLE